MKRRSALLLGFFLLVLVGVALAIPSSPVYLAKLLQPPARYQGQPLPYWLEALNSPEKQDRREAARALARIGSDADEAVPALTRMVLEDPDMGVRVEASFALTKVDAHSPALVRAVPALARALEDQEIAVRMNTAQVLLKLGGEARPAIPALLKAIKDKTNDSNRAMFYVTVQEMAALAVGKASAGTAEAVPALRELLAAAKTSASRQARVRAVGFVGPDARPALPELRDLLKDRDPAVVFFAKEAIDNIERGQAPAK